MPAWELVTILQNSSGHTSSWTCLFLNSERTIFSDDNSGLASLVSHHYTQTLIPTLLLVLKSVSSKRGAVPVILGSLQFLECSHSSLYLQSLTLAPPAIFPPHAQTKESWELGEGEEVLELEGSLFPSYKGKGVIEKQIKANAEAAGEKWVVPPKQVLWMWQKWSISPTSHRVPVSGHPGLQSKSFGIQSSYP